MSDRIQKHITQLNETRKQLFDAFDQVGDRGDELLYSEGAQWSIHQLAIHLMISDAGHNRMAMGIAAGEEVIPENYDLERFNTRSVEKRAEMTLDEVRAAMESSRAQMIQWLGTIDDSVLDIEGRHAIMKIMPISQILDILANHEAGHAQDIMAHLQGG